MLQRKILLFSLTLILLSCLSSLTNADLIELEPVPFTDEWVVIDTSTNLMWTRNVEISGFNNTWDQAISWAADLNYAGYSDWRLPSVLNSDGSGPCTGYNCSDSEMGHLFYVSLGNSFGGPPTNAGPFEYLLSAHPFWLAEAHPSIPSYAWYFDTDGGYQWARDKGTNSYAWAVRAVPIPGAVWLFGSGILGLAGLRRKSGK